MTDLRERVVSGIVLGLVFAIAAWFGGIVFVALLGAASCTIWFEWCGIRMPDLDDRLHLAGVAAIITLTLALWLSNGFVLLVIVLATTLAFSIAAFQLHQSRAIKGMLYAVALLVAAGHLRGEGDHMAGFVAVCFLCAVVFATDIGAYFVGRWLGGPKLSPTISPNKTISGAVGGLIAAMVFATLTYVSFGLGPFWVATALAIPLSIVSQFGDLYESSMKRTAGVKDSGKIIPGHGGVMDRVDGLLFAAFALWLVSIAAGHWDAPADTFFAMR